MGTVLRRFPRKTVNSQTDSDAAYTRSVRAVINQRANFKKKNLYILPVC